MQQIYYSGHVCELIRYKRKNAVIRVKNEIVTCAREEITELPPDLISVRIGMQCKYDGKVVKVDRIMRKNAVVLQSNPCKWITVPIDDLKVNVDDLIVRWKLEELVNIVKDVHADIFKRLCTNPNLLHKFEVVTIHAGKTTRRQGGCYNMLNNNITINRTFAPTIVDMLTNPIHNTIRNKIVGFIYHELLHIFFNRKTVQFAHGGEFTYYEKLYRAEETQKRIW